MLDNHPTDDKTKTRDSRNTVVLIIPWPGREIKKNLKLATKKNTYTQKWEKTAETLWPYKQEG